MPDITVVKTRVQYAEDGDFSNLPIDIDAGDGCDWVSQVPTRRRKFGENIPLTPGIAFSVASFTTVSLVYLLNYDLVNFVTVTWTQGTHSNSQKVPAGQPFMVPAADIANITVVADTAPVECVLVIIGT